MSQWLSKAPASTMILGEHSVVYGQPALVAALDQKIQIEWLALDNQQIIIQSDLAHHQTELTELKTHPKLKFVIAALQRYQAELPHGLQLNIQSQLDSSVGLGSSASVLAACLIGLNQICQTAYSKKELFKLGLEIIQKIQGRGSGADLAASLFGGLTYFQPASPQDSLSFDSITATFNLSLIYSGYKTPTAKVLEQVAQAWQTQPKHLQRLYQLMGDTTRSAYAALQNQDSVGFYHMCNHYHGLMDALGISDQTLSHLVYKSRQLHSIQASKISGSGLGDCVLALSEHTRAFDDLARVFDQHTQFNLAITPQGAEVQVTT